MKYFILVLAVTAMSGCAHAKKYRTAMNSWQDEPVENLKAKWGQPVDVKKNETDEILTYKQTKKCETQFLIQDKKVKGWRSSGSSCRFNRDELVKYTSDSGVWNTRENSPRETKCVTSNFGGVGFTNCRTD